MPEVASKKPWQSKMIVLNAVMGLLAAAALFAPGPAAAVKQALDIHPEQVALAWSILNLVLRAITKDKISLGD